ERVAGHRARGGSARGREGSSAGRDRARRAAMKRALERPLPAALILFSVLVVLLVLASCIGRQTKSPAVVMRAVLALLHCADQLPAPLQTIMELRVWRTLTTAGVGAALALSGA